MPQSEIQLPTAWGRLAGTLVLPEGAGPWPAVVLVAGSGPTDRDGNTPLLPSAIDNLKRLAEELAGRGIASLRYDKRGLGASLCPGLSEEALRFEHLVDDAALLAGHLAQDARISRVVLAGHSEGALVAALAAQGMPVQAVVSIAGAGRRASSLIREQVEAQLPPELLASARKALDALEQEQPVTDVPDDLVLLFRPSVQPYLMSWFRHDPAAVLARLEIPVLLVHGSADAQLPPQDASRLQAAQPQARLRLIDGMDHIMAIGGSVPAGTGLIAAEMSAWLHALELDVPA
jgi:alpha-beta hydrolase superfamily lysophospholipase